MRDFYCQALPLPCLELEDLQLHTVLALSHCTRSLLGQLHLNNSAWNKLPETLKLSTVTVELLSKIPPCTV